MSLVESASAFLLKVLPSGAFLRVRNAYLSARTKAAPLIRRLYGTYDTAQLIAEIDARIDDDWQVLMVHSSLNGLAPTYTGNPLNDFRWRREKQWSLSHGLDNRKGLKMLL